jgi:hypothetical protein
MTAVTDKKLNELWRDPNFSGSYRGIRTFQVLLKTDLNIEVSKKRLYSVLKKDKNYIMHQKPVRNFERRHYDVNFYGELCQMDLAVMYNYSGFVYFLLLIDCFSLKMFAKPLKSKSSPSVSKALQEIFEEFGAQIHVLQSDRGTEFIGCKKLFREKKIVFRPKFGKNKASISEWAIHIVKKKLYMLLRGILSQDWVDYLPKVVEQFNHTPQTKLGGIAPENILSLADSAKVFDARKNAKMTVFHEPNFKIQNENQKNYESISSNLQVGDFVFLTLEEKLFDKSFDVKVKKLIDLIYTANTTS